MKRARTEPATVSVLDEFLKVKVLAGNSVSLWQTASNRAPLEIPLAPYVSDARTCLLTSSGSYLFVAGTCIWLLLLSQEESEGVGAAKMSGKRGAEHGRSWSQPSAFGSSTLVVRSGGSLPLPDTITVRDMRTPQDQKHLVAIAACGELLIWKLDKAGLANHIVHNHPALQVCIACDSLASESLIPGLEAPQQGFWVFKCHRNFDKMEIPSVPYAS